MQWTSYLLSSMWATVAKVERDGKSGRCVRFQVGTYRYGRVLSIWPSRGMRKATSDDSGL